MPELNLDVLFALAEAGPTLDKVSAAVPQSIAQKLDKLQQDVGLEIDHEMTGAPLTGPGEGPESARLRKEYEPVTPARLGVLRECLGHLPEGDVKESLADVVKQLPSVEATPVPSAAPGLK